MTNRKRSGETGLVVLGFIILFAVLVVSVGAFFGWLIMLAAGIFNYSIPFFPAAWGLGIIFSFLFGGSAARR